MRAALFALSAVALLGGSARPADEKESIVGVWEIAYSDTSDTIPVGTRLEFTADGKLRLTVKGKDGKERTDLVGAYKVEKEYLVVTAKDGDKPDKGRVCLLNKTSLVLHDETDDKVMVLKRAKAK
jgi:uncharacterized protein (TIGR03066 family)